MLGRSDAQCATRYPGLVIAGSRNGYFRPRIRPRSSKRFARSRADLLFVGMPSPFKDVFCERHGRLDVPVMMGVGGSFDVIAGFIRRAPRAAQELGLEWAWRLMMEPRKLWKRYLTTNSEFIWLVVRELWRSRGGGSRTALERLTRERSDFVLSSKSILVFMGTRPEAIKLAPVVAALRKTDDFACTVVATGQHKEMFRQVIDRFGVDGGRRARRHAPESDAGRADGAADDQHRRVARDAHPDMALVQGDTTTVLVAALACFYRRIPIGHVEAGLRTGNIWSPFPEEANRKLATPLVTLHFAPTESARAGAAAARASRTRRLP